jgi:hypothetical protein
MAITLKAVLEYEKEVFRRNIAHGDVSYVCWSEEGPGGHSETEKCVLNFRFDVYTESLRKLRVS